MTHYDLRSIAGIKVESVVLVCCYLLLFTFAGKYRIQNIIQNNTSSVCFELILVDLQSIDGKFSKRSYKRLLETRFYIQSNELTENDRLHSHVTS